MEGFEGMDIDDDSCFCYGDISWFGEGDGIGSVGYGGRTEFAMNFCFEGYIKFDDMDGDGFYWYVCNTGFDVAFEAGATAEGYELFYFFDGEEVGEVFVVAGYGDAIGADDFGGLFPEVVFGIHFGGLFDSFGAFFGDEGGIFICKICFA